MEQQGHIEKTESTPPLAPVTPLPQPGRLIPYLIYFQLACLYSFRKIMKKAPGIWWFAALIWGGSSYAILVSYIPTGDPEQLNTIWMLCSLMWLQFGLASTLYMFAKKNLSEAANRLFVTLLPPLTLHFVIFSLVL
ncbi:MAG: hypothetical protein HQL52_16540 [Magnetococcales bacterium]|nr:hypothetical protein [Magnetococcales bacterium]